MTPPVSDHPKLEVRALIARYFFGSSGVVSARALLTVVLGSTALIGLGSVLLQWGLSGLALGLIGLVTCIACAISTVRLGAVVAGAGALFVLGHGLGEGLYGIGGPPSAADVPLALRASLQLLVLGAGMAGGVLIGRVVEHYLRAGREREQRFHRLLAIAADAYWEMDDRFRLTLVSKRGGGDVFVPRPVAQLPPWQQPGYRWDEDTLDALRADLEARRPFRDVPLTLQRPGRLYHLTISGEPQFDGRGQFTGYWGVTRDVTADVKARRTLLATETRHRELFARIPTALVLHRGGRIVEANPAAVALFGYPDLRSMIGAELLDHYEPGAMRELGRERIARFDAMPIGRGLPPAEFRLEALDGRRLTVRGTGVRIESDGEPAILSIYVDDTERRAAEDQVRRSEALLSHLVATSPDVITLTDIATGRYAMVNDTFARLTGYAVDEVIGRTPIELGVWKRPADRDRLIDAVREHGSVKDMPTEFVGKRGRRLAMLVSAARFAMDGRDYLVINARDVTAAERARLEREAILENASIGIAMTRDQTFQLANPAFEQMFGWPAGSLVGRAGRVVWSSDEEYEHFGRDVAPRLGSGEQVEIERTMARADGGTFLCRLLARAVDPTHPSRGGTIWIAEDVTERRAVEAALGRARDDAETASRAKSAFLANTSHEIRTPLNGLVGLARLARQPGVSDARRRQYLEQITDSAETLAAIISDILDLSKVEAGKLHIDAVPFALHTLLATLHRGYQNLADARALAIELQIEAGVPETVLGDPIRVRQIVSNYIANALKFTSQGSVRIAARRSGAGRIRFEVRDTGPGIDRATQARLFQPFTQADQSTTRRFGGTGLGLSICRQLATLMGGAVGVDSEPGTGSCFWAELPLPATDARASMSGFGNLETSPLAGAKVLMAEDNPVNMMIAVALLEQWGAEVVQASDGRQAIDAVAAAERDGRPFDAVLMDVQMPGMSGYEATRVLRRRHDSKTLPIIALTAAALVSERDAALGAGMNDFLTKPIDAQRLHLVLAKLLATTV